MTNHGRSIYGGILVLSILLAVLIVVERRAVGDRTEITPETLHGRIAQGDTSLLLLDVRTPEEFNGTTGHLKNALLIPVQELSSRVPELQRYRAKTIVAYCRTGRRSSQAADILRAEGFTVLNMTGGITSWKERKFPVSRRDEQ